MKPTSKLRFLQISLLVVVSLALFVTRGTRAANEGFLRSNDWNHAHLVLSASRASTQKLHLASYGLGQTPETQDSGVQIGIPDDWTHHHLIFSAPDAAQGALSNGQRQRLTNDPRYVLQQLKRGALTERPAIVTGAGIESSGLTGGPSLWQALGKPGRAGNSKISGWMLALQVALMIVGLSLTAVFFRRLRWTSTLMVALLAVVFLSLSSCGGGLTSVPGSTSSGAPMIGDWSMLPGAGAVGVADVFPAKASFAVGTASCSDFVVYPAGVAGSATVPSIVAYTNLYSGCATTTPNAPAPNVQWAVNLNAGTVITSPILSFDTTQVAFVATIGGVANLVVLNMPSSPTGVAVNTISSTGTVNSNAPCTAPCAKWIAFNGGNADTYSSPFLDYLSNAIYVGDDKGVLHKFVNVFHTADGYTNTTDPSEVTGGGTSSGWPETITANDALSSPVYDGTSGKVFVGINAGSKGIASIPSTGGSTNVILSTQLNKANSTHSFDIAVDSTTGKVYVFTAHAQPSSPSDTAGVAQLPVAFTNATAATWALLGTGGAGNLDSRVMYVGDFDNNYYTGASNSNLYVCASSINSSTATIAPTLFRIPMGGTFGATVNTGPIVGSAITNCSPVTEFYNGTADYIFLSQTGTNITTSPITCPSGTGCIMSFNVTNGTQTFSTTAPTTNARALETSGTSGIIIDNDVSTPTGASQVYFSVLGTTQSCARVVTGNINNGSTTLGLTAGIFTAGDVGAAITGTGVPNGTTISSVTNSTTAIMSAGGNGNHPGSAIAVSATGGCAIQASQSALN